MAEESEAPFDLDRLRELVEMMEKHDLREVRLRKGDQRWVLRRGPQEVATFAPAMPMHAAPHPVAPATAATPAPAAAVDDGSLVIKSPMVGTFYRSATPGEKAFVKEGDRVNNDTIVCLIEAMKFFNQIKADCSGTIVKVLASDGDPVDYGQPLFKIKPE
ncbi:MAG: acetyl-CoA carboxylase biotin carboxyl carrier protein [Planctomycetaceae bacterium]